jgi:hypothetical protein
MPAIFLAVLLALTLAAPAPDHAVQRRVSCAGWTAVPSPNRASDSLSGVAATSARNAWAVGSYDSGGAVRTLIEHWNGTSWRIVPSPNAARTGLHTTNALTSVVALSRTNAWAFGLYERQTTSFRTLVLHWNGTRWSVVPSPNSGTGENALTAAAAVSPSNIWAVGFRQRVATRGPRRTLVEHWNGANWKVIASPDVGTGDNFLFGVAVARRGRPWAVGSDSVRFTSTLAMRWNGAAWKVVRTANRGDGDRFLQAVAAPSARSALAVGSDLVADEQETLAERWDGSTWSLVPSASPDTGVDWLFGVAATSPSSAWAVGERRAQLGRTFRTLIEHWNGSSWSLAASPSPGAGDDPLSGIAAVPDHGGFWAVGSRGQATLIERHC